MLDKFYTLNHQLIILGIIAKFGTKRPFLDLSWTKRPFLDSKVEQGDLKHDPKLKDFI